MKALHKTELEVGTVTRTHQGIQSTTPRAFVTIETDDENLRDALIEAVKFVEIATEN